MPEKQLNLKKVMNPEGKLHDWTDLPAEEIPEYGEIQQMATGGFNPEAARQMVENLEACKGKGKMRVEHKLNQPSNVSLCHTVLQPSNQSGQNAVGKKQSNVGHFGGISSWPAQNGKTFQSSYAEVFKNRRGIFEQGTLFDSRCHKTLDDLNLAVPRVTNFTKELKSVTKPKGSRVQFEDIQGKNENSHIANHYNGKRVSDDSDAVNSDHKSKLTNKTQNTEIINIDTCHAPFWTPLARSRTAPNLVSSHGTKLTSSRNKFEENCLLSQNEQKKVNITLCSLTTLWCFRVIASYFMIR